MISSETPGAPGPPGAATIHPTAVIDPSARLGENVSVGAYSVIGPNCQIGDNTVIGAQAVIEEFTRIGRDCQVRSGAILGGTPQDHKFSGERSYLEIGERNLIREFVTLHRATGEEQATIIGDDNLIMAYAHVGHNCRVGSGIMMANGVTLGGHVAIEDGAVLGGIVAVHQFVRVGKLAMIGAYSKAVQDIPPFMLADGRLADVLDLNARGLRRAGIGAASRAALRRAYKLLYRSSLNVSQALEIIEEEFPEPDPELSYLVAFMRRIKQGTFGRQDDRPRR